MELHTPILFLIFNRPYETSVTFESIRQAKPSKLYVAADGPRATRSDEPLLCKQTRAILEQIDWECEIKTLFRDSNLGCRQAVSSAIDWFFENEEEGIIIEDDCVADQTFFTFCQILLEKYRQDDRIMHISGANYQNGIHRGDGSYYFSRIPHIWGWATWKRAWKLYDIDMTQLPDFIKKNEIKKIFDDKEGQKEYIRILKKVYDGGNTWDFQWSFTCFVNQGFCISPNVNFIKNIGFGDNATHTLSQNDPLANKESFAMYTIKHPSEVILNKNADYLEGSTIYQPKSFVFKVKKLLIVINNFLINVSK
jgi:hypothetical protein